MKIRSAGLLVLSLGLGCFSDPPTDAQQSSSESSTSQGDVAPGGSTSVDEGTTGTGATTLDGTTTDASGTTGDTSGSSTHGGETGSESTSGGVELLECVETLLDPPLGTEVASVDTQPQRDSFAGTCGGETAKDVAFQWIAPFTDYFVFDTVGSDFDTALYLLETCDGEEIACSDNANGGVSSRLVRRHEAGEQVVIVVDGETGQDGNAVLNINPVACPNSDLDGEALPGTFTNIAGTASFSSPCGGDTGTERAFRYTAEETGLHSFRATSTDFQPIMNLQVGPECGGEDLQCNGSNPGEVGGEVIRNLQAGDAVTLIVDSAGGTGEFELSVDVLPNACPSGLLAGAPVSGTITELPHAMTTSCGNIGEFSNGMVDTFGAATYAWTSPGQAGTNSGCDVVVTSGFPAALSLQAGATCAGVEEQCSTSTFDDGLSRYVTSVGVGHIPPTDYTVTVTQVAELLTAVLDHDFEVEVMCWASI
ncbi:MAG: hypothetical protein ACRBN8_25025 [Nannocystales bacterium]